VKIKAIHTVGSLGRDAGGPSRTVPALCQAIQAASSDCAVQILAGSDSRFGANLVFENLHVSQVANSSSIEAWNQQLIQLLNGMQDSDRILHDHGQWLPCNRASARVQRGKKVPRIVTPRGMLSPWAMQHKRWKKKIAWHLFAKRDINQASVVHATSDLEANELRQLGVTAPIVVIPNGVESRSRPRPSDDRPKSKTVLFMSRIHEKKGVAELVTAWRRINDSEWKLVIAGPDESNMIAGLNLSESDRIEFVGEVSGADKWRLLESASVFVLPTHSENFGVVIAESLMAGTPVITTHGAPWQILEEHQAGWWIPMSVNSVEQTLRNAIHTPMTQLAEMGLRGHDLVVERFGWPQIGQQMLEVYRSLL
jgi:glycosyltransferase involved in cell wall biosynthesis